MDRPISSNEASERFSELLRDVAEGESFVVTDAGKPVAKLGPTITEPTEEELAEQAERIGEWLAEQRKRPFRVVGPWTRDELDE